MITFDKQYLGTDRHLQIYPGNISWVNRVIGPAFGSGHHTDYANILELYYDDIPPLLPERYKNMCLALNAKFCSKMLHKGLYLQYVKEHIGLISDRLQELYKQPYCDTWVTSREILDLLVPAPVDFEVFADIERNLEENHKNKFSSIKSTVHKKYFEIPRYFQNNTKTGRLTVASGPNILTMPSEWKVCIRGARQIDFVSMEPMLLLAVSGAEIPEDVYDWIRNQLELEDMTRAKVKILTIISMSGGGKDNQTTRDIDQLLGISDTIKKIESTRVNDTIFNYFGRPIKVDADTTGRHLFSLWLQSSAVDASLLGFTNFIKANPNIKPHWIIHDGMVFTGECNETSSIFINKDIKLPVVIEDLNADYRKNIKRSSFANRR